MIFHVNSTRVGTPPPAVAERIDSLMLLERSLGGVWKLTEVDHLASLLGLREAFRAPDPDSDLGRRLALTGQAINESLNVRCYIDWHMAW